MSDWPITTRADRGTTANDSVDATVRKALRIMKSLGFDVAITPHWQLGATYADRSQYWPP